MVRDEWPGGDPEGRPCQPRGMFFLWPSGATSKPCVMAELTLLYALPGGNSQRSSLGCRVYGDRPWPARSLLRWTCARHTVLRARAWAIFRFFGSDFRQDPDFGGHDPVQRVRSAHPTSASRPDPGPETSKIAQNRALDAANFRLSTLRTGHGRCPHNQQSIQRHHVDNPRPPIATL